MRKKRNVEEQLRVLYTFEEIGLCTFDNYSGCLLYADSYLGRWMTGSGLNDEPDTLLCGTVRISGAWGTQSQMTYTSKLRDCSTLYYGGDRVSRQTTELILYTRGEWAAGFYKR